MKGRPVDQLVYEYLFPKPRTSDPHNFNTFLQRHLVLEVRQEVHAFYGHLDTPEAKYPGLDYTHPTHRMRLSRWQWHRRLFRAFDGLRLTPNEIAGLTKWEGTKWAKERYEKEQGITIQDTTEDDLGATVEEEEEDEEEQAVEGEGQQIPLDCLDDTMAEDSDEEITSVADHLNERLVDRVAQRNASGDLSISLDEAWERWFKNAVESGELPAPTGGAASNSDDFRELLAAARGGRWDEIPENLRPVFRAALGIRASDVPPRRRLPTRSGRLAAPPGSSPTSDMAPLTRQRSSRSRRGIASISAAEPPSLSSFDLDTAPFAAQFFQLRRDWSNLRLPTGSGDGGSSTA